jgi:hypothetical protein
MSCYNSYLYLNQSNVALPTYLSRFITRASLAHISKLLQATCPPHTQPFVCKLYRLATSFSRSTQTLIRSSQSPDNARFTADDFASKPAPPIIIRAVVFVVHCVNRLTLNRDNEQASTTLTYMICCRGV